jgi:flagellar basal body L-ring protein FlgH
VLSEITTSSITLVNNIQRDNSITVGGNTTPSQFNVYGAVFGGIGNAKNKDNNTRTSSLQQTTTSTLSARIMEILPNGDFAIEASRTLLINTEPQVIKIKGTIRPLDIGIDNSIASSRICNAHIICDGLGRDANRHRSQGLMQQLRRLLF